MATQTLMLVFAGIEGPAAIVVRRGNRDNGIAAGDDRLIRGGLAGHGG